LGDPWWQTAAGRHGLGRAAVLYQAWYFIPLLLSQAVSLHVNSIMRLVRERRTRRLEVLLLGMYLGCAFAPNHKGMPAPAGSDAANLLRRQVLASRDVRPGWLVDWALGGLNYRIEHHHTARGAQFDVFGPEAHLSGVTPVPIAREPRSRPAG
jgi:hypothetical protein